MFYLIVIVATMVLDRAVKMGISSNMAVGDTIPVVGDFFHITYVQNTGAAFSLFQNHPLILLIFPSVIILIGLIFLLANSKTYKPVFLWALALMLGGGLGNLTDRFAYGYVIDMFDFGTFPVFNVADICVCVGCGLLALYMIVFNAKNPDFDEKMEKRKKEAKKQAGAAAAKEERIQKNLDKKAQRKAQNKAEREREQNSRKKPKRLN